ncbi:MAG: phosphate signaling complex protein PhoU [Spirochaetaceae bacterium]|nr:phosphate signaling complex protein PhoU [Spirochaetaceae bacterium]MDE0446837.1 phosphate signaling complex protein PhoU [Spirochaetaceae bacterium]
MVNGESSPLRGQFDLSMEQLRGALLVMGQQVERSIRGSVNALGRHDVNAAVVVLREEADVNRMHHEIDDSCLRLLATEQPVATDLRQIVGTLNVIGQLERIGDLAVHVASVAQRLAPEQFSRGVGAIMQMAEDVCAMVGDSLQAFVSRDAAMAEQVSARDRKVDEVYANIFRDLLSYMMENTRNVAQASSLLFVAKQLERVGDHSTNICESVILVTTGKHVDLNRD